VKSDTAFLLHLASVGVSGIASLVLYVKLLEIAQDLPAARSKSFPHRSPALLLEAARTKRGRRLGWGLVIAQAALLVAFIAWVI
jgi:hypothetical protein